MPLVHLPASSMPILEKVPNLNDTNWYKWSKGMKIFFMGAGIEGIADGDLPEDVGELRVWKAMDRMIMAHIFSKVTDEFHYLIEDLTSGKDAWATLKGHFEASTMGNCMAAREEFYGIMHDTSRPISFYVQSLTTACSKMEALGCTVSGTEFKDVLLMRLHSSFESICIQALALPTEPSLADIKGMIACSTAATATIKTEEQDYALAACGQSCLPQGSGKMNGEGVIDENGHHWCNNAGPDCCQCGWPGHIATYCMYNMPQLVRDWVARRKDHSYSQTCHQSPPPCHHSPPHHHSPPPHPTAHHAQTKLSHSATYVEQSFSAAHSPCYASPDSDFDMCPLLI
jgi:hypothetical protein